MQENIKAGIGGFMLRLSGWKVSPDNIDLEKIRRCVIIAAPHTSNADFFYAMFTLWKLRVPVRFLIKDAFTKNFFTGWLIRFLGGIGVDRQNNNNLVGYSVNLLESNSEIAIMLAPEGTRGWVERWRRGFYNIAKDAGVPMVMAYLDYKTKTAGVFGYLDANEPYGQIIEILKQNYGRIEAKKPELFNKNFN